MNRLTQADNDYRNSYQQEKKEIRRMYTMLFIQGEEWISPDAEEKTRL